MNNYTTICKLGQGAFSTVYKVRRNQDGEQYALKRIKIMSLKDKEISNCLNEVRILASLDTPYIVNYKDSFFDEVNNTFCIITEYLSGGDLQKLISQYKMNKKMIPQKLIWRIAFQILNALCTLHKSCILHRDIKPANVFLTKSQIAKLGDMNVSIVSSNGMAKTQTGTPYYASPQVWNERPYNSKCDIWSFGCVLYQMAAQRPPFVANDLRGLKKTVIVGNYKKISNNYSDDLNELITLCLKVDPRDRLTADQLLKLDLFNRHSHTLTSQSITDIIEGKLLAKIEAPRKYNFRVVKDRLPKSRFQSLDKPRYQEKNKQNIINNSQVHSRQKFQLRRCASGTRKVLSPMKKRDIRQLEKPPLIPKSKILRA